MSALKLRNIGPKSAAWLRQVGLRSAEDLAAVGAVGAFVKVRRAGFKPSLNLLYSLEGALVGCHWQEVPDARRQQLVSEYEAAAGGLPAARAGQMAGPVRETRMQPHADLDDGGGETGEIRFGED
ncbi:TfoX/Sxy family protein [Stenotrophomonas acidaminiphila]|uniref:TfoX/Sxy family protein n=1 Tax=Stenotrophomonas acidaminiphila TaxID=128780 RepID=UPI003BF17A99